MMTTYKPQKFKDVEAIPDNVDTVQLKYDGWWSRVHFTGGSYTTYSKTDREVDSGGPFSSCPNCVFIAEYLWGTQWAQLSARRGTYAIFDLVELEGVSLLERSYADRITAAKRVVRSLPPKFTVVGSFPVDMTDKLWRSQVLAGHYEGVVFKNSADPYSVKLARWKPRVRKLLRCVGFAEGQGKHEGRLGALHAIDTDDNSGTKVRVGGGLSDEERELIWNEQDLFLNRWFVAEGRKIFDSGALRHPNFIEWR